MGSGIDKIVAVVRATPERSVRAAWYDEYWSGTIISENGGV